MHNISNLLYFGKNTLHVSDGLSVHHQDSKIAHTASNHTGTVAALKYTYINWWQIIMPSFEANRWIVWGNYRCILENRIEASLFVQQVVLYIHVWLGALEGLNKTSRKEDSERENSCGICGLLWIYQAVSCKWNRENSGSWNETRRYRSDEMIK